MLVVGQKYKCIKDIGYCITGHYYECEESNMTYTKIDGWIWNNVNIPSYFDINNPYKELGGLVYSNPFLNRFKEMEAKNESKQVVETKGCICGGKKLGYKDYTRMHYHWCNVYKE